MSVVGLFSAKGAPGVTTTAMLVASLWPRPALLVDCDPAGGDVGLRLPDPGDRPLDLSRGMLGLLPAARRGLDPGDLLGHSQPVLGGGEVIVGVTGTEQAAAVPPNVWSTIAQAFGDLDSHDVVVDLGRLDSESPVLPVARSVQLLVCVLDASVTGVFAARARLRTVIPAVESGGGMRPALGIVVRAPRPRDAQSAASVIVGEFPNLLDLGFVAEDRGGVRVFHGVRTSRPERSVLVRSGATVVANMQRALHPSGLPVQQPSTERVPEPPGWVAMPGADPNAAATRPGLTVPEPAAAGSRRSRRSERGRRRRDDKRG